MDSQTHRLFRICRFMWWLLLLNLLFQIFSTVTDLKPARAGEVNPGFTRGFYIALAFVSVCVLSGIVIRYFIKLRATKTAYYGQERIIGWALSYVFAQGGVLGALPFLRDKHSLYPMILPVLLGSVAFVVQFPPRPNPQTQTSNPADFRSDGVGT